MTARTFSTLTLLRPAKVIGTSTTCTTGSGSAPVGGRRSNRRGAWSSDHLRKGRYVPTASRIAREHPDLGLVQPPHRECPWVVGIEHAPTIRLGDLGDDCLDLSELVEGVDPVDAQMVGTDVGHDRDVVVRDSDAATQDPTARRFVTANSTPGWRSTRPAPPGPEKSPASTSSPSMYTPSVLDQPTDNPARRATCPIIRAVVVLPLVPVIATTGMLRPDQPRSGTGGAAASTAPSALIISATARGPAATLSSTRASPYAIASARPELRHGYATTSSLTACPVRVRTANLVTPDAGQPADDLGHQPYRETLPETEPGAPGRALPKPSSVPRSRRRRWAARAVR